MASYTASIVSLMHSMEGSGLRLTGEHDSSNAFQQHTFGSIYVMIRVSKKKLIMAFGIARKACLLVVFATLLGALQACSYLATSKRPTVSAPPSSIDDFNPAGVWLYEDRLVVGEAKLDENGNGSYPWKGGYFVTESWEGGVWKGKWYQPGNDREGGFELKLSPDLNFAAGRWWYTRIGTDTSPDKPGGKITLTRM